MSGIYHLARHLRNYGLRHRALYALSFMLLLLAIFDGLVSYISPLLITERGISKTLMGVILGSSSVAGALFDFLICRVLKSMNFRRIYLLMFAACFLALLFLWQATVIWLFLLAMVLWGLYYDLQGFGGLDFISREATAEEHSSSFGVLSVFSSFGYLVAPLIVGFVIAEAVGWQAFFTALIFLCLAFLFYFLLLYLTRRERGSRGSTADSKQQKATRRGEVFIWRKLGTILFPVLLLTMMLNLVDAFFWTIGPLMAQELAGLNGFQGLFMVMYTLPALIIGWFVGPVTKKLGKKRTALLSFLCGSLILISLSFFSYPFLLLSVVFLASCFFALAWPALNGAYADYAAEAEFVGKEIASLRDAATNLGYIIGPMLAGLLADKMGESAAFSALAALGVLLAIGLWRITPRHINISANIDKP